MGKDVQKAVKKDAQKDGQKTVRRNTGKDVSGHARMAGRENGITAEQRQALLRVRAQALLMARLNERLRQETADGLCSIRLDGMPGGKGGVPQGLDARIEKRDALRRIAVQESALLRTLEKEARCAMDSMKPDMYAFCALYYISGMSIEQTAEAIDRSRRQCMRYRQEIEQETDGERGQGIG